MAVGAKGTKEEQGGPHCVMMVGDEVERDYGDCKSVGSVSGLSSNCRRKLMKSPIILMYSDPAA